LADYLGRTRGVLADPEQIIITAGYVQALALLTDVLRRDGVHAFAMEDPGLPFHRAIVQRAGVTVVPLPMDEHGARTDLLMGTRSDDARSTDAHVADEHFADALSGVGAVVVTPAHQYPMGATLHPARRRVLTDWARSTGGVVIEDDYDGEFRYDRQPVGALQGTAPDRVVYVGTASKTLGPAVRLAWMVLPRHLVAPLAEAKLYADHQSDSVGQLALADLIGTHGYDRHVRAARLRYRSRRDLLLDRLESRPANPAAGFALHGVAAGLHALLSLPAHGPDEDEVLARAAEYEVSIEGLNTHWHGAANREHTGNRPRGLIVGYGTPTERAYPAALDALAHVLRIVPGTRR
ncbi:MAG: PLP-dependent aminotransferase family protein, partial [Actinocrinis sp.]